jgi:hypothetical protein
VKLQNSTSNIQGKSKLQIPRGDHGKAAGIDSKRRGQKD